MAVRLGINPITWTNDDVPELGGDIPLETCLAETRAAGFAGTELGGKFPRAAAELRPILARARARAGLRLVRRPASSSARPRQEFDAVLPHLTLLRDLGARSSSTPTPRAGGTTPSSSPISRRPRLAEAEWPAYGRKITALAERMADVRRRAWRSTTTWAPSSRPTPRSTG